ncbi:PREDICTED: putative ATP synthase subunit f, mitochondrial [Dufourea novaeangliae]|uniref:putative ATP synthase subunit f, mitochondrial n=1 Tax=Dufourea novaeangliae TaxID=178035 RepID=UPI0007673947|nr:PREDICTED: putative ATP synthase subunit f, mitochondrial [Dufourea novaeangliae]
MRIGDYPIEYDPGRHGPYDPARYYGKPDTPFGELKLAEIPSWLGRRNKGIRPLMALGSRAFWRWQHKHVQPRKAGIAPLFQVAVGSSIIFYVFNYLRIRGHRNYKYH